MRLMASQNRFHHFRLSFFLPDSLVLDLQLLHDGDLSGGLGQHDPDANPTQGLCSLQQGG